MTDAADHERCAIGVHTHNLAHTPRTAADLQEGLRVFAQLAYVRPEDVAAIPVAAARPRYVVYAPLSQTPLPPDVVLLFVRPDQILILAEASESLERGRPPAMGRPACAVIPQAMNTGQAALSLGCCGARAYLDALRDDTALYALPGARLPEYASRIAELANANAVLTRFHRRRRQEVEAGGDPTVEESLAHISASGT